MFMSVQYQQIIALYFKMCTKQNRSCMDDVRLWKWPSLTLLYYMVKSRSASLGDSKGSKPVPH